ncbi:MAG: hypothetical protein RL264_2710 [Bacteroidota bacterium]|jgi:hypothetical protein
MTFSLRKKYLPISQAPFTDQIAGEPIAHYNSRKDKLSEMTKKGELISLRRGLYITGPGLDLPTPHKFVIANHLRGPSYISLETALQFWGIIPEQVYEITSVTTKRKTSYVNSVGRFSFQHLPSPYYSFGIQRIEVGENQFAMIASKEKAICDKIVLTSGINLRSKIQTTDFLLDDMRMDEDQLKTLDINRIKSWIEDSPKSSSLEMLVKTLEKL